MLRRTTKLSSRCRWLCRPGPPSPVRTKDVYSRALKHSGDKVHPRIHPAFTETLADAKVSDLSSSDAVELFFGDMNINNEEGGESAEPPLYGGGGVDWLHPSGTSDYAKGVSVVSVVDPSSRKGLRALEQVCVCVRTRVLHVFSCWTVDTNASGSKAEVVLSCFSCLRC